MPQPRVDLVHGLGQANLQLARLRPQYRSHPDAGSGQQSQKCRKNYGDAEGARHPAFLEPVSALGKRQSEQNAEKEEKDDRVADPQQPQQDVETENDRQHAYDVACLQAAGIPDVHAEMLSQSCAR